MKKAILIILTVLLICLIAAIANFDDIIDYLPIDQSGWVETDDGRLYLNEKGDPETGWKSLDGKEYYFDADTGLMHTGWLETEKGRYFLNDGGQPVSGWQTVNNETCYFDENCILQTGFLITDESRFYLDENGHPVSGPQTLDGKICYVREDGTIPTGWLDEGENRIYLDENGYMVTGWVYVSGNKYFLDNNGYMVTGWLETENGRCYLDSDGSVYYGWLELDGVKYYMHPETGCAAVGMHIIDDTAYFFTSTGENLILVNPWHPIPEDYETELISWEGSTQISSEIYDALLLMITDCKAAGYNPHVSAAYITHNEQKINYSIMLEQHNNDHEEAIKFAFAPGTSEHQLGLAVDITTTDQSEDDTETQQWLTEHCWEYGFIPRYPDEKSDITGINFAPCHYRYVGVELALELRDSGLCLEEYLDLLTNDGTTCGNPEA